MILNRQRRVRIPVRALDAFLAKACKALRVSPDAVTICLVTNAEMARWNRLYRGKDRPTDVLSFPVQPEKIGARQAKKRRPRERRPFDFAQDKPPRRQMQNQGIAGRHDILDYLGDVAIAPEVARRNAESLGRTFGDEMRILILHGILHLMGYDHETDTGQMERREQRLRRTLGLG
jgi:probable rRNA maturation factor